MWGCEVKQIPICEKLEEEATALQRAAWSRPDGGADACVASNLATEAAAIIKELVEALEPFAAFATRADAEMVITNGSQFAKRQLQMGDCQRAFEALKQVQP
jgi:hypothetical protein